MPCPSRTSESIDSTRSSDRSALERLLRRPIPDLRTAAREEGMRSLREAAIEKVFAGMTTLREINKVTFAG